jgi:Zn-dependent protease with chaperone function
LSENLQKKVSVYITNNDTINAFATGFLPQNRVIVMGRGLMEKLTQEEREAILYHEVGHHKHYDLIKFYFWCLCKVSFFGISDSLYSI